VKTAGFSLVEVLVATAVVVVSVISVAQLIVVSAHANRIAARSSVTLLLAERKMEELIGETDSEPSPPGVLMANTPGYVSFLDPNGTLLGTTSSTPPLGTLYVCRWSVEPLPAGPATALVLQVLVLPWPDISGQTRLVGVKAPKAN